MSKVLACPSCGNKHPLDLLVGLDTFSCSGCSKTLSVPKEAITVLNIDSNDNQVDNKVDIETKDIQTHKDIQDEKSQDEDIVVVARASIDSNEQPKKVSISLDDSQVKLESVIAVARANENSDQLDKKLNTKLSDVTKGSQKDDGQENIVSNNDVKKAHIIHAPHFSLPFLGHLIAWAISVPTGFALVVIVPRLFGFGFHASDFVDVITNTGLGRYKIVILLIFFWSIAVVGTLWFVETVVTKIFHKRKRNL